MDAQPPTPYPPQARPAERGFVLVPPRAEPAAAGSEPGGSAVLNMSARAPSQSEGRIRALEDAARQAAARGLQGSPRIVAESFSDGVYTGLVSFQRDAPGTGRSQFPMTGQTSTGPRAASESQGDQAPEAPQRRKPSWILAVPVEAGPRGGTVWSRDSPWSRAWIAPVRRSGMRIVAITGDADERDLLTPALLDDPEDPRTLRAMQQTARKYGAPAISLLRQDRAGGLRAWVWWRDGHVETGDGTGTGAAPRDAALDLLVSLVSPAAPVPVEDDVASGPAARPEVDVEEHQEVANAPGEFGFSVVLASRKEAEIVLVRRAVTGVSGVWVRDTRVDPEGLEVTGVFRGTRAALERALDAAGVRIARY